MACRIPSSRLLNAATTPSEPVGGRDETTGFLATVLGAVDGALGCSVSVAGGVACAAGAGAFGGVLVLGRPVPVDDEFVFWASIAGALASATRARTKILIMVITPPSVSHVPGYTTAETFN